MTEAQRAGSERHLTVSVGCRGAQIQAELGEGHVNIIEAKEVLLTETHLALVMEFAAGNSLTGYVADKWQHAQHTGLFLGEDEARYFFKVRRAISWTHTIISS